MTDTTNVMDLRAFADLVERAARVAEAMTVDDRLRHGEEDPWTTEDVLRVSLRRGLELLEQRYGIQS